MTPWPDPTSAMLESPQFEAVWQCIKTWDIAVPDAYSGYCGATGNHVRAILDALVPWLPLDVQGWAQRDLDERRAFLTAWLKAHASREEDT